MIKVSAERLLFLISQLPNPKTFDFNVIYFHANSFYASYNRAEPTFSKSDYIIFKKIDNQWYLINIKSERET